jgi:broad specificity phosphatase PhoE
MERVILVRHGESELSSRKTCNGDPALAGNGLTERGHAQARALGERLAREPIDLCVTSEFARARETADVALAGRDVPLLLVPELNDIRFGRYEGAALDEYRAWAGAHGPADECPGGGESRAQAARRFAAGYRIVLARAGTTALVVAHVLPIRYALTALADEDPSALIERVQECEPFHVSAPELERAVARLEAWAEAPVFA